MAHSIVHAGPGQQNNFFAPTRCMAATTALDTTVITQHQPSPPPSPVFGPAPAREDPPTIALQDLWQDELWESVLRCPWIISSSPVNSVLNAELGHDLDLRAIAHGTRDRVKVDKMPLPPSFLGLEHKGLRFGRRVSRHARSSSNFPNQLSLTFKYGRSHVHIMLFDNGSLKMAGARSMSDARTILWDLLRLPNICNDKCPHKTQQQEIVPRVSMYKRSYRLPMELKLEELAYALETFRHEKWSASVEYGITRSTAVKLYLRDVEKHATVCKIARRCARNCTVSMGIFRTGFVMATGRNSAQLYDAMDAFTSFLAMHYDDVVELTAEDLFDTADDLEREDNTNV
jgi:TATA-box binding protein (TBP) (component of TFIID and TFIIIB)